MSFVKCIFLYRSKSIILPYFFSYVYPCSRTVYSRNKKKYSHFKSTDTYVWIARRQCEGKREKKWIFLQRHSMLLYSTCGVGISIIRIDFSCKFESFTCTRFYLCVVATKKNDRKCKLFRRFDKIWLGEYAIYIGTEMSVIDKKARLFK